MGRRSELILSDAFRVTGRRSWRDVIRLAFLGETFRFNVALRLAGNSPTPVALISRFYLRRLRRVLGINISARTTIGAGLLIGHSGGIVVSSQAKLGMDCNLAHGVTIGVARGSRDGAPTIGDRVYIGPGAVIVGDITIGDDVAIGANVVVVDDVPPQTTVHAVPARHRLGGSRNYVHRTNSTPQPA